MNREPFDVFGLAAVAFAAVITMTFSPSKPFDIRRLAGTCTPTSDDNDFIVPGEKVDVGSLVLFEWITTSGKKSTQINTQLQTKDSWRVLLACVPGHDFICD